MSSFTNQLKIYTKTLKLTWSARPGSVIGFMLGAIAQTGATILTIYATAKLGNLLAHHILGQPAGKIWFWLWVDVLAAIIISLSFWLMSYCKRLLYFKLSSWSTHEFFRALCTIDLPDFYDNEIRNQINKANNGYTWQISNLAESCLDLVYALIRFLAIAAVVAQITWWLIPLVALFLIPSLINEAKLSRIQWFVWDEKGDNRHVFWKLDWLVNQPFGQFELRSAQARHYIRQKIDQMNSVFYQKQEKKYNQASRITVPTKVLEAFGVAIGSIVLLRQFLSGAIFFDRYLFLSGALLRVVGELNNIFGTLTRMQEPMLFAENFFGLIDRKPVHVDKPSAIKLDSNKAPVIEFQNLTFSYPNHDQVIFKKLNLTINPGEHVALVGENGAGKSTLIKLLMRFYKPTSGRILVNGIDLEDVAIETWYEHLATLFQTFNYYPFPVQENIEIARPNFAGDKKRLLEAADFGGVEEQIKNYEHGWETVLDPSFKKGIEPSGGQWQRIGLARAFYRHANVLILDEPTSAIDAKAEYDIFNNIFDHYKDKTALIISHRFSTVRRAGRIVVLDKGQIIEQGTHSELMKHAGLYHEMFTKQAEGYRD
jgi:ATP-binding cassette subfamily B protein